MEATTTPTAGAKPVDFGAPRLRFIRQKTVLERTGYTKSGLNNAMLRGDFPRPVYLSARHTAWVESEVEAWAARKAEERERGAMTEKQRAVIEARRRGGRASAAKRAALHANEARKK